MYSGPNSLEIATFSVRSKIVAPRAYWKGYLTLSLVSCPIALFPATSEREKISFHQSTERASDKKMVRPAAKREAVVYLRNVLRMSERRACLLIAADRKMVRYRSRRPSDVEPPLGPVFSGARGSGT